ncbi:MAG TPA: hypothetical protein VMF90_08080 [Rhizobiaceae bacterium]|nr:hypothetical protein [Rhizobiaceae bacterium]
MGTIGEVLETEAIDYWTPDGLKFRAWRETRHGKTGFIHAPNADRSRSEWVDVIRYVTFNGTHWCARWSGDEFVHFPEDRPGDQHRSQVIDYVGWHPSTSNREAWQAYWDDRRKLFVQQRIGRIN